MDTSILEGLGLTKGEIMVYLSLLELGPSTASPIINKSELQSSVVHMCLNKLLKKGLISYVKKGSVKNYKSTNPKNILNFIEEKKDRFEEVLPELLLKQKLAKDKLEAEIFVGLKGFKTLLYTMVEDAKKGDEWLFFSFNVDEFNEEAHSVYKKFDKVRVKKNKLVIKGIAPNEIKEYFKDRGELEMKYVDFPIPANMSILNDKVLMTPWSGDQVVSFLINSKQLADSYRKLFYSIWSNN